MPEQVDLYSDTQTRPTPGYAPRDRGGGGRATSSPPGTPPRSRCRSGSRDCWATRLPCSFRRARCATRSPFGCTSVPAVTRCCCTEPRIRSTPRPEVRPPCPERWCRCSTAMADSSPQTPCSEALRPRAPKQPRSRLVSIEQTTNLGGGRIWPLEQLRSVLSVARDHGLRTHLDGARLLNAVVASGVSAAEYASAFDTAWIDFTKGLGAPVGACLAGSRELIDEAWRYKHMWGGALRQSGILAAAALYALDHHVERLAEDHRNATAAGGGTGGRPRARDRPGDRRDEHRARRV